MKNLLLAAVAVVALVTPAMATYTECTVTRNIVCKSPRWTKTPGKPSEETYECTLYRTEVVQTSQIWRRLQSNIVTLTSN